MVESPTARPLTNEEKEELLGRITGGWQRILTDAIDVFDRPGFVAGNEPRSPLAEVVRDLTRLNCRLWARADKKDLSPNVNAQNAEICSPYLQDIGELPTGEELNPPFAGGQCAGTEYVVLVRLKRPDGVVTQITNARGRFGPISRSVTVSGTSYTFRMQFRNSSGVPQDLVLASYFNASSPPAWDTFAPTAIVGPDNCGNPDPVYVAPGQITGGVPPSPNLTVNLPGVGEIDLTVSLDSSGRPVVCIPALDVCATVDLPFFDEGGDDAPPTGGPPPGDIGSPGSPSDVDGGGSGEGEAAPGEVLTALKVEILETPANPKVFAPGVFRGVAYIYLGTAAGLDHDPAGAMLVDGQLVLAEKENLTHWQVRANVGYRLRITPYYREVST